jgi:hypothetical protein
MALFFSSGLGDCTVEGIAVGSRPGPPPPALVRLAQQARHQRNAEAVIGRYCAVNEIVNALRWSS